ncbi:hypothetical protein [Parerythrobacter jejuensis]|uniref:Lipoprotein n=1 Tax=Parerythrobacter jejuensis TaxID=795812 RepID=A0A845AQU2_9SPHN|nr:hypothetical protein [Parerythrobacter jejuensis]MXP31231.1 hypothetical protein [Parerythrobacter jejuensis]MXP33991.1 hypothetical protein [Parerythrobacter jejuensis]
MIFRITLPFLALAACSAPAPEIDLPPTAQDKFWQALSSHCGKAFAGQLVSDDAADTDMQGAAMVMHVRECSDERIAIPFHIEGVGEVVDGWNRSRTWVLTRNDAGGLRLKHDHRHADGKSDTVTMYGGDTAESGTAKTQSFPVDAESIAMFETEGLDASVTNVWTVAVDPAGTEGATFAYQLQRTIAGGAPEERFFRVEFDLTQAADAPPAPWGHD